MGTHNKPTPRLYRKRHFKHQKSYVLTELNEKRYVSSTKEAMLILKGQKRHENARQKDLMPLIIPILREGHAYAP